jgi:putative ATPase
MIEAGEDPRFIARRLIVHASEDVGMADPTALQTAVAAAQAVQLVGLPEARINLAQAVIHVALAPKSNAVVAAINAAEADVRAGLAGAVPKHLRDASYPGAARLGHGKGYVYPHDDPAGVVEQQYAPAELSGKRYYQPTRHGAEARYSERSERIREILDGEPAAAPEAPAPPEAPGAPEASRAPEAPAPPGAPGAPGGSAPPEAESLAPPSSAEPSSAEPSSAEPPAAVRPNR